MYEVSNGLLHLLSVIYLNIKIVIIKICDTILRPLVKTTFHGTKSISYLGATIWDILPVTYKTITSFRGFQK